MPNDRSSDAREQPAGSHVREGDAVSALLRTYGNQPPYDAVNWEGIAARILAASDADLARRRSLAGRGGVVPWRVRAWWEVAAGWARPAVAAAVAMIAVASALVIATPAAAPASGAAGTTVTASTDGADAAMLGSQTSDVASSEAMPITRDSLFSAVVDGR
jgi:hypothetical protein